MILFELPFGAFLPFLLWSFAVGAVMGVIYDAFRLRRRILAVRGWAETLLIAVEDVCFITAFAVVMILLCYKLNYGIPRWYAYAGAWLGLYLWVKLPGRLTVYMLTGAFAMLKRLISPYVNAVKERLRLVRLGFDAKMTERYNKKQEKRMLDSIFIYENKGGTEK